MGKLIDFPTKTNSSKQTCGGVVASWKRRQGTTEEMISANLIDFLEIHLYNLVENEVGEKQALKIFHQMPDLLHDCFKHKFVELELVQINKISDMSNISGQETENENEII